MLSSAAAIYARQKVVARAENNRGLFRYSHAFRVTLFTQEICKNSNVFSGGLKMEWQNQGEEQLFQWLRKLAVARDHKGSNN
jgi:hypothetical protein